MRRILLLLGVVFSGIALCCLTACAVTLTDSVRFRSEALRARGVIVDVRSHTDCDNSGCDDLYTPVIRFSTESGRRITFTPNGASSHQPQVGDPVTVLYRQARPEDARLDGFGDFWLAPVVTGGVALMMAGAGVPLLVIQLRRRRPDRANPRIRVNGVHPWQVHATWLDPATGQRHFFRSENLIEDPRDLLGDRTTTDVIIDPGDPGGRYRVELPTRRE
jgi:hypothetical protein